MKKLNDLQVEKLYDFTSQHYVKYYDVQTELVDHLANGIEAQWQEDPEISFEDALQKEFKKFGVFGFSDIVEKRERAMEKKYFKIIWKESKLLLKKTEVAVPVVVLFFISNLMFAIQTGSIILLGAFILILTGILLKFQRKMKATRKRMEKGEKVYLLENIMYNIGSFFSIIWIPFHIFYFTSSYGNIYWQILMATLVTIVAFVSYVCFFYLPKKKDEILLRAHPEIKFLQ